MAQNPGKESRRTGEAREGEGGGAPGPGSGRRRQPRWGCVWVCPRRGVLREGLARGRARKLCSPEPKRRGRSPSAGRGGGAERLHAPGAGCSRDAAKERPV